AVFLRSAYAAAIFDPGIRTADNVVIEIANEETRGAMVQAVTTDPSVAAVAASWPETLGRPRAAFAAATDSVRSSADQPAARTAVACRFVSPEYFSVL